MTRASTLAVALVGALAAQGCVHAPWNGDPELPKEGKPVDPLDGGGAWQRLEFLEHRYRDVALNYAGDHPALDKLKYPRTADLRAAWLYVTAGDTFAERPGAAARAYWAALALVQRTLASRAQREEVRRAAYAGLARIARARKQPRYAELLELCATLAQIYVRSPQAADEEAAFYDAVDQLVRRQQEIDEAARRATVANVMNGINAGLQQANAQLQAASLQGPAARAQAMNAALARGAEDARKIVEAVTATSAAYDAAMSKLGAGATKFKAVVAEDVAEVEAGKSFVAVEVATYLAIAKDVEPFLEEVRSFAKEKPGLYDAVQRYLALKGKKGDDADAALVDVAKALQQIEVDVARCERGRKPCPPPAPAPPPAPPPRPPPPPPAKSSPAAPPPPTRGAPPSGPKKPAACADPRIAKTPICRPSQPEVKRP